MRKISFFTLLGALVGSAVSFSSSNLYAQSPATRTSSPDHVLNIASPNAAALGRYGDTPVNLYTGIPSIGLPLYTIKLKKLEIPISLSYHAGGVKVDDNASDMGLGWSLNFGGSVATATYGLSDTENTKGWYFTGYQVPQTNLYQTSGWNPMNWELDPQYIKIDQVVKQDLIDTQPDLFYLSFNGQSIKFFYDTAGYIKTMPYRNISVTGDGGGFVVIDENDVRYEFKISELNIVSSYVTGPMNPTPIPQSKSRSYFISKIVTPDGEIIDYEYEDYSSYFNNQISETRYRVQPGMLGNCGGETPPHTITVSNTQIIGKRIKKISANTGAEVNFSYGLPRTDITGNSALTSVIVKSTVDNQQIASYVFSYGYNGGRLNLLSLAKDNDPPYMFEYDGNLPERLSKGQDHWGYINNSSFANSSTTLPLDLAHGFNTGVSRDADIYAKTGTIKKITYPTGGYTLFEFENNTVAMMKNTEISKSAMAFAQAHQTVQAFFSINSQKEASVRVFYIAPEGGGVYDPETGGYGLCTVEIKDIYGTTVYIFNGESSSMSYGDPLNLPDGDYIIEIKTRFIDVDPNAYLMITWTEEGAPQLTNIPVGGIRVKSITDNPITGTPKIRRYEYDRKDQPDVSSGWVRFMPQYIYEHVLDYNDGMGAFYECKYYAQNSTSVSPLGTIQGGPVAYEEVKEYIADKTEGYTYHLFSKSMGDNVENSYIYPYGPLIGHDWLEGLLLEKVVYQYNSSTLSYKPLSKVVNQYKTSIGNGPNESSARGVKAVLQKPGIMPTLGQGGHLPRSPEFGVQYYRFHSSWTYPTKKVETLYDPIDTNKKVITQELYYYDNPAHIALTRQEVSKSDGEQYRIQLRYPKDIDPYFAYLANPVVEKRVMINDGGTDRLVMSELSTYLNRAGAPLDSYYAMNLKVPVIASTVSPYSGTLHADYSKKLTYSYDAIGNVKTITKEGALPTVYLWSYQGQYPIAQIIGADYATVVGVLGQSSIDSFAASTPTDAQVNTFINQLRAATVLANSQITSYTHKPLVGISTQTDPKGMTIYYHYDTVGRLQYVKDHNGYIVKTYDYHYKP